MSNDLLALSSEVRELESILRSIPEENVIERSAFEERLESARNLLPRFLALPQPERLRLTFRGKPVTGSHGIAADFGTKAAGAFADAFAAVVAGLNESLSYMGPIPDKAANQLLITGTAVGSFGFEFELPVVTQRQDLFPVPAKTEEALEIMQTLFDVSASGSDDQVTELVDAIHPRAVKKISEFLSFISQQDAWCGLEFRNNYFRYQNIAQIQHSVERLKEENIHERDETFLGEFQGVLPSSRTFEFKIAQEIHVLKGKLDFAIQDPDVLNREWLHKLVEVRLRVVQVGQGRPKYTLLDINAIKQKKLI
jgi:hypothetical protein